MTQPWADHGYLCYCVDIQHPPGETREGNHILVGADVRTWRPPVGRKIAIVFCNPPCTDLAVSGSRWFKGKGLRRLAVAIELFAHAAEFSEWAEAPYYLENPVSVVSSFWRKPDQTFDPCDYARNFPKDRFTKKTCLWTGGKFVMPPKDRVEPELGSKMHLVPPGPDRANIRSACSVAWAIAVFNANFPFVDFK